MGTLTAVGEVEEPPSSVSEIAEPDPDPIPTHVDLLPPHTSRHWNDWRWQMRQRIHLPSKLATHVGFRDLPDLEQAAARFPMAITPYYLSLIKRFDASDPIFAMAVPQIRELEDSPYLRDDPLEEDHDMPVPGLVHRYSDRALLVTTSTCAMYCRHCTRKRVAGQRESSITPVGLRRAEAYLRQHPEIHDVILSGGDPLTLPTATLERILSTIRAIPSVEIIRIGTRVPVTLPMRVDDELVAMLRQFHPVWLNTHFNHPAELTDESRAAVQKLADAGLPLGNQTVLLRGINDDPAVMETLCRSLVRSRVRPYYLFQCDLVRGVEHFRTPLSRGIQIMEHLRGRLSGLAIPNFVVDAPQGGGKIPVLPNYVVSMSPSHTVLRNFEGVLVSYPEPNAPAPLALADAVGPSVSDLNCGRLTTIGHTSTARHKRRLARG